MNQTDVSEILRLFSFYYEIGNVETGKKHAVLTARPRFGFTRKELKRNFPRYRLKTKNLSNDFQEITVYLRSKEYSLNLILLLITLITTLVAGAIIENGQPWRHPGDLSLGIPFSLTLMLILGAHELGHFYFAKKHGVDASLPYFIPAPTIIGTFGAFIRMRSPVKSRQALIQIGAAGPIAGFCVALPAFIIGMQNSFVAELPVDGYIQFGDSLLTWLVAKLIFPNIPAGMEITLSSVGFAAWIGFLVTMLNLLPIGQLDGGHIAYALFGRKYNRITKYILIAIVLLGAVPFLFGYNTLNWLIWAALVFFLIKIKHPSIMNETEPLSRSDISLGIITLLIFLLTFIPIPIQA